ncbi:type VII toxin-antitoxin system HepT family RNase toxin [Aliivibrio wodanis]|uniref:type VII toxin-antitoxin system HepT family RNase toxin n=1 Tax=Aliivibrio wodanis TaxID=80852 RepID=UPI00406CE3EF
MNKGLELYLAEVESHKAKYLKELNELRFDLNQSNLKSRDYLAAERLLQVFTEMCIGLSKHMVKKIQNKSPTEAYQSFSLLKEHGLISSNELRTWKQIIGMRNGLVHDYLNIDLLIVEDILREGHYQALADFTEKASTFLLSESK